MRGTLPPGLPVARRAGRGHPWSTRRERQRLEHEVEDLEERSERVGEHIEETREDWESKEEDPAVPGAQPDPDEPTRRRAT